MHLLPALVLCATCCVLMLGCGPQAGSTPATTPPKPMVDPTREGNIAHQPGDFCFSWKENNAASEGRLSYTTDGIAEGTLRSTLVDASNGLEAVTNTSFKGNLRGDTLYLEVMSDETGSRVNQAEKWVWKGNTLVQGGKTFQAVACR